MKVVAGRQCGEEAQWPRRAHSTPPACASRQIRSSAWQPEWPAANPLPNLRPEDNVSDTRPRTCFAFVCVHILCMSSEAEAHLRRPCAPGDAMRTHAAHNLKADKVQGKEREFHIR